MEIGGLRNNYNDYIADSSGIATTNKLDVLGRSDKDKLEDEALLKVCKEFEAYFLEQVFKEMDKTVPKQEGNSKYATAMVDYFKEGYYKEIAASATENSQVGFAQQLYEQMKRNYGNYDI